MKQKQNQCGRSMIEMLGVLAIIAVLSVGGIAGYSKAMIKFKANKTVEQITHIVTGFMTAFANQKEYGNIYSSSKEGLEMLETLGIVSKADIVDGELKHHFGGMLYISSDSGYGGAKRLTIELDGLSREACLLLSTTDWESNTSFVGMVVSSRRNLPFMAYFCNYDQIDSMIYEDVILVCKNDKHDQKGGYEVFIPMPLPPDIAAKGCSCKEDSCVLQLDYEEGMK